MGRAGATLLLLVSAATPAMAQELTAMVAVYGPFGVNDLDGDLPTSAELRLTIPISQRFAIEPFGTVWSQGRDSSSFFVLSSSFFSSSFR